MPSRRQQQQSGGEPTRQVASCISCRVASCSLTQQHSRAPLAHRLVPLRLGRGGTSRGTGLGSTGTIRSAADQRTTARTRSCQLTKRRMTFGRRWTRPDSPQGPSTATGARQPHVWGDDAQQLADEGISLIAVHAVPQPELSAGVPSATSAEGEPALASDGSKEALDPIAAAVAIVGVRILHSP